ncbi:MAG: adenylyltransferase/cytidyltransferase family protein [Chitinispirillaceae bacterium]|nr:adenylyltransferase/cytidyltransferase family protein [Chitinispirillaceae bacterium]
MKNDRTPVERVFGSAGELARWLAPLRAAKKTLVTTNGCFDIIHSGHVRYLTEAAQKGDLLVVGVNADAVVRKLKGEGRPLRPEDDRVLTVAALSMVDAAFIFSEDDPRAFLETLRPDLHVKGGDYTEKIIERETVERHGGKVAIAGYAQGYSTTSIINRAAG